MKNHEQQRLDAAHNKVGQIHNEISDLQSELNDVERIGQIKYANQHQLVIVHRPQKDASVYGSRRKDNDRTLGTLVEDSPAFKFVIDALKADYQERLADKRAELRAAMQAYEELLKPREARLAQTPEPS